MPSSSHYSRQHPDTLHSSNSFLYITVLHFFFFFFFFSLSFLSRALSAECDRASEVSDSDEDVVEVVDDSADDSVSLLDESVVPPVSSSSSVSSSDDDVFSELWNDIHKTQHNCKLQVTWLVVTELRAGYRALSLKCTSCCDYFLLSSVVLCAFSALCMYSKFRHHPHPLGYVCAKFCFFHSLHCWASPWRIIAYSITHSPHLFDAAWTEDCGSEKN